jgi:hypothetical protein
MGITYTILDNRGKRKGRELYPHECFSVVKKIGEKDVWETYHYTQDEAESSISMYRKQDKAREGRNVL